jgi:outer membrane protein assembly factor BamE (lipoprotein component of BamABCDE complex)
VLKETPDADRSAMRFNLLAIALLCLLGLSCVKPTAPATSAKVVLADSPITLENYEKIKVGMTLPDVEAILGPPFATSGVDVQLPDGTKRKDVQNASWMKAVLAVPVGGEVAKQPDEVRIVVEFNDGKVTSKSNVGLK